MACQAHVAADGDQGARIADPEDLRRAHAQSRQAFRDHVQVRLADIRQLEVTRVPGEQRLAKELLKQAHMLADAGLGQVEFPGGLGEALLPGRRLKTSYPVQI
jgi:hypothetical protein